MLDGNSSHMMQQMVTPMVTTSVLFVRLIQPALESMVGLSKAPGIVALWTKVPRLIAVTSGVNVGR